jgi:hypothetical protein
MLLFTDAVSRPLIVTEVEFIAGGGGGGGGGVVEDFLPQPAMITLHKTKKTTAFLIAIFYL